VTLPEALDVNNRTRPSRWTSTARSLPEALEPAARRLIDEPCGRSAAAGRGADRGKNGTDAAHRRFPSLYSWGVTAPLICLPGCADRRSPDRPVAAGTSRWPVAAGRARVDRGPARKREPALQRPTSTTSSTSTKLKRVRARVTPRHAKAGGTSRWGDLERVADRGPPPRSWWSASRSCWNALQIELRAPVRPTRLFIAKSLPFFLEVAQPGVLQGQCPWSGVCDPHLPSSRPTFCLIRRRRQRRRAALRDAGFGRAIEGADQILLVEAECDRAGAGARRRRPLSWKR